MNKKFMKSSSIVNKVWVPMIIVLCIQAFLFAGTILWGGTIDRLSNNSYEILNERVINRKNYLENEMVSNWSSLDRYYNSINLDTKNYLQNNNLTISNLKGNSKEINNLLDQLADNVIKILRNNNVTGAFIILNGNDKSDLKSGLYLRDLDPRLNPTDTSDILMERGSSIVGKRLKISLDSQWQFQFNLKAEPSSDFFYKPFNAAQKYSDSSYKDLGYWSPPFMLSSNDVQVITYSVPLISDEGVVYGVLGVDVNLDYLRKMLPYNEISPTAKGIYSLCIDNNKDLRFSTVLNSGPMFKHIESAKDGEIPFSVVNEDKNIYSVKNKDNSVEETYGCIEYLQLYNHNTPFESEKWALAGMIEKKELLAPSNAVRLSVLFSLFISVCVSIVGIYISGLWITRPISNLVQQVRKSDPQKTVDLKKVNISEMDELAAVIESLSHNVADSASKLSQIIDLVNMPIGAFEYEDNIPEVFCTRGFFEVLGFKPPLENTPYVDMALFNHILAESKKHKDSQDEEVYRIEDSSGITKWVRFESICEENRVLGVVVDVTNETIEKRKIVYERDYDLLTNLLNRRAFNLLVHKMLEKSDIGISAFLMWDLDDLKYVNDTYGHDMGDAYIKKAALILKEFSLSNGIVGRMSGDEFFVFISGFNSKDKIRKIIGEVQKKMQSTFLSLPGGNSLKIRASAGIAWYPDDSLIYEDLLRFSDFAMYKVKNTVKGVICEFDRETYNRDSLLLSGKEELNKMIENELVEYAFQPIVSAKTGNIYAYEALMRPMIESLSSPLDVLRLAKSQSKLYLIEKLTMFKVMNTYVKLLPVFKDAKIFINSIPNHILSEIDILLFESLYREYTKNIVFELLEGEQANSGMTEKKELLIRSWKSMLALDDFGAGYNNDAILLSVHPDLVKIDMSIVKNIDKDINRQKILANLISYAKERNIKVIAEGVETREEMNLLIKFGVDYLQGFYLGKPNFIPQKIDQSIVSEIYMQNLTLDISR